MQIRNSIFFRLIATFLIAIILIILLGIYMYNWSLNTVKNEIVHSSTAQASFYLKSLEEEIERIKILQYDALNDEYLAKLAIRYSIMNEYDIMESMRRLQQRLVTIHNSNAIIADVSVHIMPIAKSISSTTSVSPIDQEKFEQLRMPEGGMGAQLVQYKGSLYLTTLHRGNAGLKQKYMIAVELDTAALQDAMGQFQTYADSVSLLIDLTYGKVISADDRYDREALERQLSNYRTYESDNIGNAQIDGQDLYVLSVKSDYLNMLLLRYIPQELIFVPLQGFYYWLWIFTSVSMVIIILYFLYTYNLIHKPMRKLVASFRHVESGNFNVQIHVKSNNDFGYLYQGFNSMVQNVSALIDQVYKQKIFNQRAELKQLQSQINPHFLYNSLFLIHTMAKLQDDNLIPFTRLLGEYFQFITRDASDFLTLSDEIEHARAYTGIQLMRFPSRLTVHFEACPDAYREVQVPRLILQPLIENAFKYAVEQIKGKGIINIQFLVNEQGLSMIVEDNGQDLSDDKLSELQKLFYDESNIETSGLINIHRRIRLIYGDEHGLQLERSHMGGLKATLRLNPEVRAEHVQTINR